MTYQQLAALTVIGWQSSELKTVIDFTLQHQQSRAYQIYLNSFEFICDFIENHLGKPVGAQLGKRLEGRIELAGVHCQGTWFQFDEHKTCVQTSRYGRSYFLGYLIEILILPACVLHAMHILALLVVAIQQYPNFSIQIIVGRKLT